MALEESFASEIESAVDEVVAEQKEEKEFDAGTEITSEADENVGDSAEERDSDSEAGYADSTVSESASGDSDGDSADTKVADAPKLSDAALTAAVQAGFSLEEARKFGSDELLKSVVDRVVAAKYVPPAEKTVEEEKDIFADLPKLDPDTYEPEIIKAFDSFTAIIKQQQEQIKGLQEYSKSTVQLQQDAATHEVESWFDKQTAALGKDFEDALGAGPRSALNPTSPQYAKREAIANRAAILLAGYQAAGQQVPSRDEVFQVAAKLELMEEFQKVREKKISSDLEKRSGQHINRAGGNKQSNNKDPFDDTAALLDEKYFR